MILHGLSPETLARLLSLDRPGGEDSRQPFGPVELFTVESEEPETNVVPLRWAAE